MHGLSGGAGKRHRRCGAAEVPELYQLRLELLRTGFLVPLFLANERIFRDASQVLIKVKRQSWQG